MKAYVLSEMGKGVGAWQQVERPDPVAGAGEVLVGFRAAIRESGGPALINFYRQQKDK